MKKRRKNRKRRSILPLFLLAFAVVLVGGLTLTTKAEPDPEDNIIPANVYVQDIAISGMTKEDAAAAVESYVAELGTQTLVLTVDDKTLEVAIADLGLTWTNPQIIEEANALGKSGNIIVRYKIRKDLEHDPKVYTITYAVDEAKITQILNDNLVNLDQEVVETGLTRKDGAFVVSPGKNGIAVNVAETVKTIVAHFTNGWDEKGATLAMTAEITAPKVSTEQMNLVQDVLGKYTTSYTGDWGRVQNLISGTDHINGFVLLPGEEFTTHDTMAPFDSENGYQMANGYNRGEVVETMGGGICQVSTTLYNAVIRAELEVTERWAHSMEVTYVDPSMDAAIATGYKDMKFVNNTDAPIYIQGYVSTSNKTITFIIYGHETRPENRTVSFVSETTWQAAKDPDPIFKEKTDMAVGDYNKQQGVHRGLKARLWKVVKVDGKEESREVFNSSSYEASAAVYEVGMASSYPEAIAAMKEAIASKDWDTVKAAAKYWSEAEIKKREEAAKPPVDPEVPGTGTTDPGTGTTDPGTGITVEPEV